HFRRDLTSEGCRSLLIRFCQTEAPGPFHSALPQDLVAICSTCEKTWSVGTRPVDGSSGSSGVNASSTLGTTSRARTGSLRSFKNTSTCGDRFERVKSCRGPQ